MEMEVEEDGAGWRAGTRKIIQRNKAASSPRWPLLLNPAGTDSRSVTLPHPGRAP